MTHRRLILSDGAQADLESIRQQRHAARKRTGRLLAALLKWGRQAREHPDSAPQWRLVRGLRIATVLTHSVIYEPTSAAIYVAAIVPSCAAERLAMLARKLK